MFHDWNFFTAILGVLAIGGTLMMFHLRASKEKVDRAYLEAKEALSVLFIHTVIDETKRLFQLVDNHLPAALGQESRKRPSISRFDLFCESLRKLDKEELDDRGKYTHIIRESFSKIISDQVEQLLEASEEPESSLSEDLINPTGIHYQLEGATEQTFRFISGFSARCYRRRWRTHIARLFGMFAFVCVCVCLFAILPFLFLEQDWAETWAMWCLIAGGIAFVMGILSSLILAVNQHLLEELALAFRSKKGVDSKLDAWKKRHA